jgi:hypothetical protein
LLQFKRMNAQLAEGLYSDMDVTRHYFDVAVRRAGSVATTRSRSKTRSARSSDADGVDLARRAPVEPGG